MWWSKKKTIDDVLNQTKTVKVQGIIFTIRKVNILNYLDGSNILQKTYDTYKAGEQQVPSPSEKKVKEYFSQVLVAGVVEPKLSFKDEDGSINVEKLFTDWSLVQEIYEEIALFTYGGKKKLKSSISPRIGSER